MLWLVIHAKQARPQVQHAARCCSSLLATVWVPGQPRQAWHASCRAAGKQTLGKAFNWAEIQAEGHTYALITFACFWGGTNFRIMPIVLLLLDRLL